MTRPCRPRYSALELSPWAMPAHDVEPVLDPGPSHGPAQPFSPIAAMYPVLQRYWPGLSVRSRLGPQRRRVAADSKSELLLRVTPVGPIPCRRHPVFVVVGDSSATVANGWGSVLHATMDRWFRRSACAHTVRSWGLWTGCFPRRSSPRYRAR